MKNILLLLILIVSINVNAQWQYRAYTKKAPVNFKRDLNTTVPIAIMLTGFAYNETNMHTDKFANYSNKQMNQTMLTGYLTTAIVSIGTHFIWKGVQNKKKHKRFFD